MASFLGILLIVTAALIVGLLLARLVRAFWKFPAPAIVGWLLDSPIRLRFYPPAQIIERSGIQQGMHVLEVGCGSGAYTPYMARAVGEAGSVAALDIQPQMLAQLERKMKQPEHEDIQNVKTYLQSAYDLPFEPGSIDLVVMIAMLQEIPDRQRALAEVRRVLKPGGLLAVTEIFQDPDYPLKSTTLRDGHRAGFEVDAVLGSFWNYTVRFRKP
ncbi:MAG: methyltransferase domain-containing protein [Anaerolineales bacterium]|jgi:ubiquinone/menaquinone biosynthesis C-methylase UbiE